LSPLIFNPNLSYYIINPQSGKALDVNGGGTANGTNIHLWERNQGGAQKWFVNTDGSIVNPQSGKVLDVSGAGTANGTNIQLWEKNGTGAQKWELNADGSITNPQSGKALDVSGGGKSNGANIHIWEKNGSEAQKWELEPVDSVLHMLRSRPDRSGKWFICHRDHARLFPHEEAVDIYEEFFRRHPNGCEAAQGFLAVKLGDAAIEEVASKICMSSYRWDGIQPAEQGHKRGLATHKGLCPVNGVQNPRGVCGAGVIGKLFPHKCIFGIMIQNQMAQGFFNSAVTIRHGAGIIFQCRHRCAVWRDLAHNLAKTLQRERVKHRAGPCLRSPVGQLPHQIQRKLQQQNQDNGG
jgi:hypothetical protein